MWFEKGFNEDLKTFILNSPLPEATLGCFTECYRYAERLLQTGHDVELCEGFYIGDGRWDVHYWLRVKGRIFDPTSAQYKSSPRVEFYQCAQKSTAQSIFADLPHVERPEMFWTAHQKYFERMLWSQPKPAVAA